MNQPMKKETKKGRKKERKKGMEIALKSFTK